MFGLRGALKKDLIEKARKITKLPDHILKLLDKLEKYAENLKEILNSTKCSYDVPIEIDFTLMPENLLFYSGFFFQVIDLKIFI